MPKRQKHVILSILLASGALVYFLFITKFGYDDPAGSAPSSLPEKYSLRSMETHEDALLSQVKTVDINDFQTVLKHFLVQRVVGTSEHENVKNYIIDEFKNLKWDVELDSFVDVTPDKRKLTFTNIIATYKADAPRVLVLACHYDSKLFGFEFIGATDSAVPCAMLVYLAKNLDGVLQNLPLTMGLQLIFFDGEEAFINWSARDSLYGSRHLANVLEKKAFDKARNINHLKRMDLLVLLDLIGASSPEFYSYFENTNKWHSLVIAIERQLLAKGLLEGDLANNRYKPYFLDQTFYGALIDDDHKPFLRKGVPVMHVIPYPFPNAWHTEADNESIINYKTVNNLLKIFKIFTIQYLVNTSS